MIHLVLLTACTGTPTEPTALDRPEVLPPLEVPDVTGVDFPARYVEALQLALSVNARTVFDSHRRNVDLFEPGCPDVYAGIPPQDVAAVDGVPDDAPGFTWSDHCAQDAGPTFSGFGYWEGSVSVEGQAGTAEGVTVQGERLLVADGVRGDAADSNVIFEFDGSASDAMTTVDADGYNRWSYTSLIEGTATGSDPFPPGSLAPNGWRTDLYLSLTGGAEERIEARGNVYLFEGRIGDRFDSIAIDMDLIGALGAGPDDCLLEPLGWIGLRDSDAVWYDLVFLPRYAFDITGLPYPNDPLQDCDGCGTLYIRGVEQGPICPDFSGIQASLSPPNHTEFISSIRDLPQEVP